MMAFKGGGNWWTRTGATDKFLPTPSGFEEHQDAQINRLIERKKDADIIFSVGISGNLL